MKHTFHSILSVTVIKKMYSTPIKLMNFSQFNISRKMIWGQEQNINSEVFKGCVERWSIIIEILKGKAIDHYLTGGRFLSAEGNHDADNWCSK